MELIHNLTWVALALLYCGAGPQYIIQFSTRILFNLSGAGIELIHNLTWVALALLYGGAVLAVWSLFTYLRGTWVHFRQASCRASKVQKVCDVEPVCRRFVMEPVHPLHHAKAALRGVWVHVR